MSSAALAEDISNRQFVQKRVDSAVQVAKNFYSKVEGSSPRVKASLEAIERSTEWLSRPIVSKIAQVSGPVLQTVDNGLTRVYSTIEGNIVKPASDKLSSGNQSLSDARQYVVESGWFQRVQYTLSSMPRPSAPTLDLKKFFEAAHETFKPSENLAAFTTNLQSRLGGLWDERLKAPAQAFHTRATEIWGKVDAERRNPQELYAAFRHGLVEAWEKNYIATNARSLYNAAIDHVQANVGANSNAQQLLQSFQQKAGAAWHDNLAHPLLELFKKAAAVPANVLRKLDPNDDIPGVTLNDVFSGARRSISSAQSYAKKSWSAGLHQAEKAVDYLLPAGAAAAAPTSAAQDQSSDNLTVSSLVFSTLKRLRSKVEASSSNVVVAVRTFSTQKLEPTLHVDVVKYSEDAVKSAHARLVAPALSAVSQRYAQATASGKQLVSSAVSTAKPVLKDGFAKAEHYTFTLVAAIRPRLPITTEQINALQSYVQKRVSTTNSNASRLFQKSRHLAVVMFSAVSSTPLSHAVSDIKLLVNQSVHPAQRTAKFEQFVRELRSWGHCWLDLVLLHTPIEGASTPTSASAPLGETSDDGIELKSNSAVLLESPVTRSPVFNASASTTDSSAPAAAAPQSGESGASTMIDFHPPADQPAAGQHSSKPHKARYSAKHGHKAAANTDL